MFPDGTSKIITVNKVNAASVSNTTDIDTAAKSRSTYGYWWKYTTDSDGKYQLTNAGLSVGLSNTQTYNSNTATLAGPNTVDTATAAIADSKTVFVVYSTDTDSYSVYTGIGSLPTISATTAVGCASVSATAPYYAKYVMLTTTTGNTSGNTSTSYAYITKNSPTTAYDSENKVTTYTYPAIVDGEISTLTTTNASQTPGLYYWNTTSKGYPALTFLNTNSTQSYMVTVDAASSYLSLSNNTLTIDNYSSYACADTVNVFFIDQYNNAEATTLSSLAADYAATSFHGYVTFVTKSSTDGTIVFAVFKEAAAGTLTDVNTIDEVTVADGGTDGTTSETAVATIEDSSDNSLNATFASATSITWTWYFLDNDNTAAGTEITSGNAGTIGCSNYTTDTTTWATSGTFADDDYVKVSATVVDTFGRTVTVTSDAVAISVDD